MDLEAFARVWLCLPSPCPQRRWDPIRQSVKLELLAIAGGEMKRSCPSTAFLPLFLQFGVRRCEAMEKLSTGSWEERENIGHRG